MRIALVWSAGGCDGFGDGKRRVSGPGQKAVMRASWIFDIS